MKDIHHRTRRWFWACVLLISAMSRTARAQYQDMRVQPPTLGAPERGSVAGQLANVNFGPADVSRGAFSLPSPFAAPSERGDAGVNPFPTYSPDAGLSEWGMGWRASLSVERWRASGGIDFKSDQLRGPWGTMVRGADGAWYVEGLKTPVRVVEQDALLVAYLPDGSTWTFGEGKGRLDTAKGTFAWYVTRVSSVLGRETVLTYRRNRSGRPYLFEMDYGGVQVGAPAERVLFDYDEATPVRDYRSGELRYHDKRVSAVRMQSRSAADASWADRYRYAITYRASTMGVAYYMSDVQQVFASGGAMPAQHYTYATIEEHLWNLQPRRVKKVDSLFRQFGPGIILADKSSTLDVDEDGRVDVEIATDNALYRQFDTSFVAEAPLPTLDPTTDPRCRQSPALGRSPRNLVRMLRGARDVSVAFFTSFPTTGTTEIGVCDRAGRLQSMTRVNGAWAPGPNVVLVDVNRDHMPDLVRVEDGRISVLENVSTETGLAFAYGPVISKTPIVTPEQTLVADFNGDGYPDVVTRSGPAFRVYFGYGNYQFAPDGYLFQLVTRDYIGVGSFSDSRFLFFDANKDGLVDVLRMTQPASALYVNDGAGFFHETPSLAISSIGGWGSNFALPLDVEGTGDTEILFTKNDLATSVALDAPETGLLVSADDGKGTTIAITYVRSPPSAGVAKRDAVLDSLTVRSVGLAPVTYRYTYGNPTVHSLGRFLIGFGDVTRSAAMTVEHLRMLNDDRYAGVFLSSELKDEANPGAIKIQERTYDDVISFGVPWKRLSSEQAGFRSASSGSSDAVTTARYAGYENELCASRVERDEGHGVLVTQTAFRVPSAYAGHLPCISSDVTWSGLHSDPSLDFVASVHAERATTGQITSLTLRGSAGDIVDEAIAYDANHLPRAMTSAGRGTTTIEYDAMTGAPTRVISPDGATVTVASRDAASDRIRTLVTSHGDLSMTQSFTYDSLERFESSWSNVGTSSATNPSLRLAYRYADALTGLPALVTSEVLVSAAGSSPIVKRGADIADAKGGAIASATLIDTGWITGALKVRDPSTRTATSWQHEAFADDVSALTVTDLFTGVRSLAGETTSAFGYASESRGFVESGVERIVRSVLAVDSSLTMTQTENDALSTRATLDPVQRVVAFRDQEGSSWGFTRDALGRVRDVTLPDGAHHRISYDDYGRVRFVERDRVARVEYDYVPGSPLLATKRWMIPGAGAQVRSISYRYDAIGRVVGETQRNAADGATSALSYYFDGATPSQPNAAGRNGFLTGVAGDGFSKTFDYRADGVMTRAELLVSGFGGVRTTYEYYDDGSEKTRTRSVLGLAGQVVSTKTEAMTADAYGRVASVTMNDVPFAAFAYDANGLVASASFLAPIAHGETVWFERDSLSRKRIGIHSTTSAWTSAASMRLNARGLVDSEEIDVSTASARHRAYGYTPAGYVATSTDAVDSYAYGYDATGLMDYSSRFGSSSSRNDSYVSTAGSLVAGAHTLRFDGLGRVVQRDETSFVYGPNGQISSATTPGRSVSYLYDEGGNRIAKIASGQVEYVYPEDGSIIDASYRLTEPARVAGQIVGLVHLGTDGGVSLTVLPVDLRGTVFGDASGTMRVASPYGARDEEPESAASLDYVSKGYDADLGLVRMGVRDYDADVGRFAQPDPAFLESPDACAANPVGCNLYGYARDNPLAYVDPRGTEEVPVPGTPAQPVATRPAAPATDIMASVKEYAWRCLPALVKPQDALGIGPQVRGVQLAVLDSLAGADAANPVAGISRALGLPTMGDLVRRIGAMATGDGPVDPRAYQAVVLASVIIPAVGEERAGVMLEQFSMRALTAADLGLAPNTALKALTGTVTNAGTTRIITVGYIEAAEGSSLLPQLRSALPNIVNAARADGVITLQIEASFANGGLEKFAASATEALGGRYTSAGGRDLMTFVLGKGR